MMKPNLYGLKISKIPRRNYLRWLNHRSAPPTGYGGFLLVIYCIGIPLLLGLSFFKTDLLMLISYSPEFGSILLLLIPVLITSIDFLYYLPRAFHDDLRTGHAQELLVTPITNSEIISDLKYWMISINRGHIGLYVILIILISIVGVLLTPWLIIYPILGALIWKLILDLGVLTAFLPRWWFRLGFSIILLILIFIGSTYFGLFMTRLIPYIKLPEENTILDAINWSKFLCLVSVPVILLILVITWSIPKVAEMRRRGVFG